MSFAQLSKPKSKSTKSTKPRSDGSDEDKVRFVGVQMNVP